MPTDSSGPPITDALGVPHRFAEPPQRIVSLVPSLSETLCALGCGDRLVGVTEFCVHPAAELRSKSLVGGTKTPRLDRILELRPDLVIANREENRRRDVERLVSEGARVFVTYARSVREAAAEIAALGAITRSIGPAARIVREIEAEAERVRAAAPRVRPRVVALIWKRPYMAVGGHTFAHDLLVQCGADNPFATAERRYPRVAEGELERAAPEVILLPSEPYEFLEPDRRELLALDCPAARAGRVHLVEGELLSWYGPRIPRALRLFSELLGAEG